MPALRFHEAARDGVLKILLEASEKDCNAGDSDGMTPVHFAAFCGHLSALRLLIAMGGKLGKCDASGNTALHHAAAGGHLKVVAFIVALGGNPWDLNADFHTPKTVAGRLGKEDVLRYLDGIMGREMAFNRRKTVRREQRAKKRALERFPSASGRASPAGSDMRSATPDPDSTATTPAGSRRSSISTMISMGSSLSLFRRRESTTSSPDSVVGAKSHSGSLSRGNSQEEAPGAQEELPSGDQGARGKQLWAMLRNAKSPVYRRMIKKRQEEARAKGLKRGDSAEPRLEECSVFFGSTANFAEIQPRSVSQPDMLSMSDVGRSISSLEACDQCLGSDGEDDVFHGHSMFERPGFGKIAFRQNSVILPASAKTLFSKLQRDIKKRSHSIGGIGDGDGDEDEDEMSCMDVFLLAWGLVKEGPVLHRAGFTLESLMTATEEDLRQAGLPMGPRKKVLCAIQKRRAVIESPSSSTIASRL